MLKKVIVGTVLVGLIGILVFGAINRTLDKTGKVAKAQGQGLGRGRSAEELASGQGYGRGRSETELNAWGGNSRGAGQGGAAERQYPNYDAAPEATMTYEGTVVQVPEPGVELVIETSEGDELEIGTGPMDLAARGFALKAGEPLQVKGYWEDNEFKAAQLTRLSTGQLGRQRVQGCPADPLEHWPDLRPAGRVRPTGLGWTRAQYSADWVGWQRQPGP